MTDSSTLEEFQAEKVAQYLRQHPTFLSTHPDLISTLILPRKQDQTISLAAYQIQQLREKNVQLEQRLTELVAIAADNEQLMRRVHDLTVALLQVNTLEATAQIVIERLGKDFQAEQIRLLLFGKFDWPATEWLLQEPTGSTALPQFAQFLSQQQPISGRLGTDKLQQLFGSATKHILSAAIVPLGKSGILAIGSEDPDRFQPGMGTLFLQMIGSTITAALTRTWVAC